MNAWCAPDAGVHIANVDETGRDLLRPSAPPASARRVPARHKGEPRDSDSPMSRTMVVGGTGSPVSPRETGPSSTSYDLWEAAPVAVLSWATPRRLASPILMKLADYPACARQPDARTVSTTTGAIASAQKP